MLCEICKKNEATIHIQEIIGGQKKSMHLCSSCAAAKQQGEGLDLGPFNLAGLLYKLSGGGELEAVEKAPDNEQLVCPACSWDEAHLNATGRLGCENCYRVFAPLLNKVLKNMHRGTSHLGKHPSGKGTELCALHSKMAQLQRQLQQAVEEENYEAAAEYRDAINELKVQCHQKSSQTERTSDNE